MVGGLRLRNMRERILEISKLDGNSHIGSAIGIYETLKTIEGQIQPQDIVVLDGAHGSLGYFVWLEETKGFDAHKLHKDHGTHQHRDPEHDIEVSGGSLGLASGVALGRALANKERNVWLVTTDGSMAEGINWEVLRIKADMKVDNLKVVVSANGWGAYGEISTDVLEKRIHAFCPDALIVRVNTDFDGSEGQMAHYGKIK